MRSSGGRQRQCKDKWNIDDKTFLYFYCLGWKYSASRGRSQQARQGGSHSEPAAARSSLWSGQQWQENLLQFTQGDAAAWGKSNEARYKCQPRSEIWWTLLAEKYNVLTKRSLSSDYQLGGPLQPSVLVGSGGEEARPGAGLSPRHPPGICPHPLAPTPGTVLASLFTLFLQWNQWNSKTLYIVTRSFVKIFLKIYWCSCIAWLIKFQAVF